MLHMLTQTSPHTCYSCAISSECAGLDHATTDVYYSAKCVKQLIAQMLEEEEEEEGLERIYLCGTDLQSFV